MDSLFAWQAGDELPMQDDRFPLGGMNPGLSSITPVRVYRLLGHWRQMMREIGPQIEGAAFQQCADQLEAMLLAGSDHENGRRGPTAPTNERKPASRD